jgi:hypothetical protein
VDVSYFLINEDSLTLLWPFTNYPSILCHYYTSKKQIPTIHDIVRIQYMIQNKTQFETVNFRLYFKVIFRQNEIQYFTQHIILYTTQRERESIFELYIEFSRCPVFSEFVFYSIFINCRLVMVFIIIRIACI